MQITNIRRSDGKAPSAPAAPPAAPKAAAPLSPELLKLISASIGDNCVVMSKSPAYKFHTLADIEWLVMPAVLTGQIYVAELQHQDTGARAPVAVVTWASVSDDIDQRLRTNPTNRIRLLPQEWRSGEHIWIVDVAGEPRAIADALAHLAETVWMARSVQLMSTQHGVTTAQSLQDWARQVTQ
jgi:hemolysin-activating ACP:hemolysin acyltransferase